MGFSRQKGFGALSCPVEKSCQKNLAPSLESQIFDPAIIDSERFFPGSVLKLYRSVADNENSMVKLICNVAKHGIIDGNFHEISKQ